MENFFHLSGVPRAAGLSLTPYIHFSWREMEQRTGMPPIGGTGFAFFAGKLRFYVGRVVPVEPTGKVPTGWEGF